MLQEILQSSWFWACFKLMIFFIAFFYVVGLILEKRNHG